MMVKKLVISLPSLDGVLDHITDDFLSIGDSLRLDIAPASELDATGLAFGDGIIGWVVGELKNGSPAFLALESDDELIV